MQKVDAVIAVAGWEERFRLGMKRDLEEYRPSEAIVLCFEEYSEVTAGARESVREVYGESGAGYFELSVPRNPIEIWRRMREEFSRPRWSSRTVLVDITTMPREVIYWSFSFLRAAACSVRYVYYRPHRYASEWVSRDTDRPRLVYQHSGISEFGKDTCLLLVSGFDTDRAAQLLQFFEPRAVIVGGQKGDQFDNELKNLRANRMLLERRTDVSFFSMDAYGPDHGFGAIHSAVHHELSRYNVVAASLGPKPSAVALYRLHCLHEQVALVYAPSRQFNMSYSGGIGDPVSGELDFEACNVEPDVEV